MTTASTPHVYFIGAGPGDPELITLKGINAIKRCQTVIYAGSLVAPEILEHCLPGAHIHNSASMNLEEILAVMAAATRQGQSVARLHTGDPSIYGAIQEQMAELDKLGIAYTVIPGVTAVFAAAAALRTELTSPEQSQTLVISRIAGRTPVPQDEEVARLTSHGGTFCFYLSVDRFGDIARQFLDQGWSPQTPVAMVYRASWPDELIRRGTLADMAAQIADSGVNKHAVVIIGKPLGAIGAYSKLYDREFSHGTRP
ncbi:precorrin-4 C(11)-methyltransferase [Desulfurispira natronophila]|uniref:Precorrin-4/cobalt-precorrin-4 C11-methyltransferase n=1 Tax=Desulfurispira natronophila TaxID=682562 RepID=A0A7W7Y5P0_9BACT|nr:precorrin-4 C(11)-methyltransferase [Desulfurispira natronophila]MBB5022550.1 precorrin-4/cobalt-precorrin-4 C11-methyltransferase [Desulfurispira natronophila]